MQSKHHHHLIKSTLFRKHITDKSFTWPEHHLINIILTILWYSIYMYPALVLFELSKCIDWIIYCHMLGFLTFLKAHTHQFYIFRQCMYIVYICMYLHYFITPIYWLASSLLFSPCTLVSSTNKTDCHDITETVLK